MAELPREKDFENAIESSLIQDGYRQGFNENYDKVFAIDKKYLFEFLENTQKEMLENYKKSKGSNWEYEFLNRLHSELEKKGVIEVLRHGLEDILVGKFNLLYSKPNSHLNPKAWEMYEKNIFSVTRQLKYSTKNENSLDMVLFLNGIPIVTLELKNEYTGQNIYNAMKQYREDRDPKELLFRFKQRALVHFALDTSEVYMATELKGKSTYFLPFNKGNNGGKGNPNVEDNFKTFYLWEKVLTRESLADIIKRFYYIQEKDKKQIAIFPRYHQLDVVRKVEKDLLKRGENYNYLIQHSAGSGKTNSIAWLSHRLANLHNSEDKNVFDSVIVITDRKVLDKQLQDAIYQLEHKHGVVEKIDDNKNSSDLAKALENNTKIIITTIQKFPYALDKIETMGKSKKFAVIIDEAHSSTSGKNMNALKDTLAGKTLEEAKLEEGLDDKTLEDEIIELLKGRTKKDSVTFFAFTATPKHKTLEIFGQKGEDDKPHPFHEYTMRQAIEEGFILDVLKNYTTYDIYYKVAKSINDNPEFEASKASKEIKRYVGLHEYAIRQKIEIIVDDFVKNRSGWLNGKAKGMIVTSSRLHAVRFKQEIDRYILEKGYNIKSLVAFSGTVNYDEFDYTEESMNEGLKEKELPTKFDTDNSMKLLIVADKYQTGFDQPKLCAMYVDKILSGVTAVQTLSRLNRTTSGKDATFILDFSNTTEEIQDSFKPYFESTLIDKNTDPNMLLDMYEKLHKFGVFFDGELDNFTRMYLKAKANTDVARLNALTDLAVERYLKLDEDEREDFKKTSIKYIRYYNFLLQIYEILNPNLYKLVVYLFGLVKKLPKGEIGEKICLDSLVELDSFKIKQIAGDGSKGKNISLIEVSEDDKTLIGPTDGAASRAKEEELETLETIIEKINKVFGLDLTENDKLSLDQLEGDFVHNEQLQSRAKSNTKEDFIDSFDKDFMKMLVQRMSKNQDFFTRIIKDKTLQNFIVKNIAENLYESFTK